MREPTFMNIIEGTECIQKRKIDWFTNLMERILKDQAIEKLNFKKNYWG
jgi:glycine cleavage system protein P-like pyridoxal-binding family